MKKSVLALAVAAGMLASAVSYADTTFYGSFRANALQHVNPDEGSASWGVANQGSRWGVRGAEDLGNGLSAIYLMEIGLNLGSNASGGSQPFGGRLAWLGLKGGFGQITAGSQWSPYYIDVASATDQFNSVFFNNYNGLFRVDQSLLYETPGSLPFKFAAMAVMDGDGDNSKSGIDNYNLGLSGSFGPVSAGLAYFSNENSQAENWLVTVSGSFAGFTLAALYEDYDLNDGTSGDNIHIYADYGFGNNTIRAAWGENDQDGQDSRYEWAVGFQHNLSARTRLWLEFNDVENDSETFNLGMRHDF